VHSFPKHLALYCLACSSGLLIRSAVAGKPVTASLVSAAATKQASAYSKLPLNFEPNIGQTSRIVQFLAREDGYTLYLTPSRAVFSISALAAPKSDKFKRTATPALKDTVQLELPGANRDAQPIGLDELPGTSNYFIGNDPAQWHRNVPTYSRVRYRDVYPGVDLVYYGTKDGQLEHDFIVAPYADPAAVVLKVSSSGGIVRQVNGDVIIRTLAGDLTLRRPTVYQIIGGRRRTVSSGLAVVADQVRFRVGAYDRTRPLVIDPVIAYGTLLGGSVYDGVSDITVDDSGSAYVTGTTRSMDFPTTSGSYESDVPGPALTNQTYVTYVSKLNPTGTALEYSTFIGEASRTQEGAAITVDH
jgi:hypothetical protein